MGITGSPMVPRIAPPRSEALRVWTWPNHDPNAHQLDFDWEPHVSGRVGDGTSDCIVLVASGVVIKDEWQPWDVVDPQTTKTSCF
jgi:hypothetical protein